MLARGRVSVFESRGQLQLIAETLEPRGAGALQLAFEQLKAKLRAEGFQLTGPLPADTLFVPALLANADCVLAMYHDQGLPVLKYASFGKGINVTLGLPIIRTSVDHGTALELAGTGRAEPESLFAAVEAAIEMAQAQARSQR